MGLPARQTQMDTIIHQLTSPERQAEIAKALPRHMTPDRFLRLAQTMIRNPKIAACTPISIIGAVMEAAQAGLELDGFLGHGYLVPYKTECKFIPGYKGKINLARRTSKVKELYAEVAWDCDTFRYTLGLERNIVHTPGDPASRGQITHAYAIIKYLTGGYGMCVMTKHEIDAIRAKSPAGKSGPWVDYYPEMAKKTAFNRLLKTEDLSPELTRYASTEEAWDAGAARHVEATDVTPRGTEAVKRQLLGPEAKPAESSPFVESLADVTTGPPATPQSEEGVKGGALSPAEELAAHAKTTGAPSIGELEKIIVKHCERHGYDEPAWDPPVTKAKLMGWVDCIDMDPKAQPWLE